MEAAQAATMAGMAASGPVGWAGLAAGFMSGNGASFTPSGGTAGQSSAGGSNMGGVSLGGFDNSGWTVATGSAKATASNSKNDPLTAAVNAVPWATIAIAAVVAVAVWKLA